MFDTFDILDFAIVIMNRVCIINGVLADNDDKWKLLEELCAGNIKLKGKDNGLIIDIQTT